MPQRKPQRTGNQDPAKPLGEETDLERERRVEGTRGSGDGAQPSGDGRGDGSASQDRGRRAALEGRQPSPEPDVSMEAPRVQVDEIYLDDEGLDVHLSLRARLANLVQLEAGVHLHCRRVELDATVVEAEAVHKVRLENLSDILDRAVATINDNPRILESLLKRMDAAVHDMGQPAQQALAAGGAGTKAGAADRRRSREGEDRTKRGARRSRSSDGSGRGGDDQVGRAAWEATDQVGLVAGETVQHAGRPFAEAVQQLRQATGEAIQPAGQPAVEASAKATWTPRQAGGAQDAGQRRRPTPRHSHEAKTNRGSKRGTLSRSPDSDSK